MSSDLEKTAMASVEAIIEEERQADMELWSAWKPVIQKLGRPEDLSQHDVNEILNTKLAPLAVLALGKMMMTAKSERIRHAAAKDVAYMGGFKPVEKTQSMNVNIMAEAEVDSLLVSKFKEMGIEVITEDSEVERFESSGEAEIVEIGGGEGEGT